MLTTPVARRSRRRAEDVEVARQLRRDRRAAAASSSASSCSIPDDAACPMYFRYATGWPPERVVEATRAARERRAAPQRGQAAARPHRRRPLPRRRARGGGRGRVRPRVQGPRRARATIPEQAARTPAVRAGSRSCWSEPGLASSGRDAARAAQARARSGSTASRHGVRSASSPRARDRRAGVPGAGSAISLRTRACAGAV